MRTYKLKTEMGCAMVYAIFCSHYSLEEKNLRFSIRLRPCAHQGPSPVVASISITSLSEFSMLSFVLLLYPAVLSHCSI